VAESRILSNYQPGFKSVLTARQGHGYHTWRGTQPQPRHGSSTLAETASIFCGRLCATR
jgi:oligoendopeptidase F